MPSNQFDQVYTLKLKSSLSKQLLIVLPHTVTVLILFIFLDQKDVTSIYFLGAFVCILFSLIYFVRLHLKLSLDKSVYKIHKNITGEWALTLKNDVKEAVVISASSFTSNLLIILHFKDKYNEDYIALITQDSVKKDEFRKLKALIKTQKT